MSVSPHSKSIRVRSTAGFDLTQRELQPNSVAAEAAKNREREREMLVRARIVPKNCASVTTRDGASPIAGISQNRMDFNAALSVPLSLSLVRDLRDNRNEILSFLRPARPCPLPPPAQTLSSSVFSPPISPRTERRRYSAHEFRRPDAPPPAASAERFAILPRLG